MKHVKAHRLPILLTAALVVVLLFMAITSPNPSAEADDSVPKEPEVEASAPMTPAERTIELAMPEADDDTIWNLDDVGARMVKPVGWVAGETNHRRYLARDTEDWLAGSVNRMVVPNLFGLDIDGVRDQNLAEIRDNPNLDLLRSQTLRVNGRNVLRFDYTGSAEERETQRIVCITYLWGSKQVALTWAARSDSWNEIEREVEMAISTLWLEPLRTESK